jgi:hypothetical protein
LKFQSAAAGDDTSTARAAHKIKLFFIIAPKSHQAIYAHANAVAVFTDISQMAPKRKPIGRKRALRDDILQRIFAC